MPARRTSDPPVIRTAGSDDAAAIAALHADSWRKVYRGILPDAYLDSEVDAERKRHWAEVLAAPAGGLVLIACRNDVLLGFVALTGDTEPGYDAFIDSLHVAAQWRGTGLGRRLLGRAAALLLADGASSLCLRVYDANAAAIGFYRRLGGVPDGRGIDPFASADMPDTRIGWRDLAALHAACTRDG
jgi:ribosomal protein S18 acetylase RimI-like enzyme